MLTSLLPTETSFNTELSNFSTNFDMFMPPRFNFCADCNGTLRPHRSSDPLNHFPIRANARTGFGAYRMTTAVMLSPPPA